MIQIKANTEMSNNHLKLTIVKREEVKINGKPISKCSYEEIVEEAKKFTETKGKGMQELRNEVVKGQRKEQEEQTGGGSGKLLAKNESVKVVENKVETKESKAKEEEPVTGNQSQEAIKSMKAPFRTKVYLLAHSHKMSAKDAANFLGSKNISDARIALRSYNSNKRLQQKALKLLNK